MCLSFQCFAGFLLTCMQPWLSIPSNGLTSFIPKSLSKYKKSASHATLDAVANSTSTADNATHFCMCDFQLTGHLYTYVTAPDMLLHLFIGSNTQFALMYVTTGWLTCLLNFPPNHRQYSLVWLRYFSTWITVSHALSIGFDIYCAWVPTANKISGCTVLDTYSNCPIIY